jgi:DNA phosphorothioation-dependent restriction protein DptF
LIRFFYLTRYESIGNNYHQLFTSDFNEDLLEKYSRVWFLHKNYDGSDLLKNELRQFYVNELIKSVFNYANRNASLLKQGDLFLGEFGNVQVAAPLTLKPDYAEIQKKHLPKSAYFDAYLKFDVQTLIPISINLNLFELIYKLNRGYRPNKYDKNAIVLLDAIIEQVTEFAKSMNILRFYEGKDCYEVQKDDGLFIVSNGAI